MTLVFVALAGGLGAVMRLWLGTAIERFNPFRAPLGTMVINISGAFMLGFVSSLATSNVLSPSLAFVVSTGFLGGFTTFSTASVEAVTLGREKKNMAGMCLYSGVMFIFALLAGVVGMRLGVGVY